MKEKRVEGADRETIQGETGGVQGKDKPGLRRGLQFVLLRRMVALHKDAAGKVAPRRGHIDPAHCVLDVLALLRQIEKLVDPVELYPLVVDHAGDDWLELQSGPGNQARQAKPADGGRVEVCIFRRRA